MKRMILLAALLLAACGSKTAAAPAASITPIASIAATATATPTTTPAPVAVATARFVGTPPSSAKIASAQTDPWIDVVAFHEVGLTPGQTVAYQVTGSASASYTCNGKAATAAGAVGRTRSFTADANGEVSDVIAIQPPTPTAGSCTAGYPNSIWGFKYQPLHLVDTTNQVAEDVPGFSGGA